ncbi:S8 family serine peptidase [Rugamonas sp. CCM 8940]|uniref:S8 family peptidase n=1 Tax=Rugamonas sp. CCM 8940 TaxID=2765359 RepID=UPI0018F72A69|nr:S8 family serine peptidase [Rugamonas sp. CCM 8940]MBJ7311461.1 S8 family serine peptidase [Rugamonas sp. CCM 8940]
MLRLPAPHYRPDAGYGGRYIDDGGRSARRRIATELARRHGLTLLGDWPMPTLGLDCYLMTFPAGDNAEHIAAQLSHDPRVEWAQPVALYQGLAAAAPGAGQLAALYPVQPAARYWHVAELHRASTGRDVLVAVVDSGIDRHHPDLAGQIALAENFVDADVDADNAEAHGTAVAGIIAARGGGAGIVGIAPAARLMALRACWQPPGGGAHCSSFTLAKALNYAILHHAGVINLSLTGPPDRLLDRLLDVALARGISVVGALGAAGEAAGFPAAHAGVIAVAQKGNTTDDTPTTAATSTPKQEPPHAAARNTPLLAPGRNTPLLAPGRDVPASAPGGGWRFVSGNSFAAAHVSGMLALLRELRPDADPAQLHGLLHPASGPAAATIDACATITRAAGACPCSCATAATASSHSHP